MSFTANFDYCIELGIAQVKEIFHLAFKSEDRYPHNVGPLSRTLSGREFTIYVRVHDDEDRPADLSFLDDKHITFSFPFDLTAETPDAPDPAFSRVTLQVRVELPGKLDTWDEEGETVLGINFADVTADEVAIITLEGLPTIDINNFLAAIHSKYSQIPHEYEHAPSGSELLLYDGNRDLTLIPPNSGGAEIVAALETHSGHEYLHITAPIHVTVPLPSAGGDYTSYGRIVCWREVVTTDTSITAHMNAEPAEAALKTEVELDNIAGMQAAELAEINVQLHATYETIQHTYPLAGNTLVLYDGNRDPSLAPPNKVGLPEIAAVFETHNSVEYLKFTLPIHVTVPVAGYTSYGKIIFWREVERTATTLTVDFSNTPAPAALQTKVELDAPEGGLISGPIAAQVGPLLSSFGVMSGPSFGTVTAQLTTLAIEAINNFGTVTEPGYSEDAARDLLRQEIANYIKVRRYPFYSPKSGDEAIALTTPVGFLLVADGVLAILLNRRSGTADDDHAPPNFLGGNQLALAVGRARVDEVIGEAIVAEFPALSKSNGSYTGEQLIETEEGDATLYELTVIPSDPGTHDQSEGHLWVSGEAEVHIDCWPDPDVSFEGPVFVNATPTVNEAGECGLDIQAEAGEFDVDQSCCDVLLALLIPVIGIIIVVVIESTIESVGGELAGDIAQGQEEIIKPIPPVVNGIAEVSACLIDLSIHSQGFIFPGEVTIRRLSRSFEDLQDSGDLPRP